jgi:general secretion pathway protein A
VTPDLASTPVADDVVVRDVAVPDFAVPAGAEPPLTGALSTAPAAVPSARLAADPLSHWGLREPAFAGAPATRFLYLSPAHAEALGRLRYAVRHRKGGAMLTGAWGSGTTTLARALARELDRARFDVALVTDPRLSAPAFLGEILSQFGVTAAATDRRTLLRALEGRLVANLHRGRDAVVIVDEAQLVADESLFTELRLLLNFQTNDRFLISLVLAGSDALIETLRRRPQLAQRCSVRASLTPLDRVQTAQYVRHRLRTAGCEAAPLTEDAVDELFAVTGGTPRAINAVCDLTLLLGAAAGARCVDGALVRRVAAELTAAA